MKICNVHKVTESDGDGLSDGAEVLKYGTNPLNPDTDGDLLVDGYNISGWGRISWKFVHRYLGVYKKLNTTWNETMMIGEFSVGSDPLMRDTDGDGIDDRKEVQNLTLLNISFSEWSGILHSTDYDNDSIPDYYEFRLFYWVYTHNSSEYENGSYLNPANASDAYEDFDSDTLMNLEEYLLDHSGDFDGDGIPDIYDDRDDNDGIPTSVEVQNHLNPYNPEDASGDLDHDGLTNLFEYQHRLSITDADTDHDGINDGDEYHYWQNYLHSLWNTWKNVNDTAVEYIKNPDVDGDNITDGKEINGYEVKIITGWDEDGNPQSEMRYISSSELDPLIPYGYNFTFYMWPVGSVTVTEYTDTDEDGIPDIIEIYLSNDTKFIKFFHKFLDPVESNRGKYGDIDSFLSDENLSVWQRYAWTIAYYYSIRNHDSYSGIYGNLDVAGYVYTKYIFAYFLGESIDISKWINEAYNRALNELKDLKNTNQYNQSCGENATKYLTSQFNPFIVENIPPMITKFGLSWKTELTGFYAHVHIAVRDVGELWWVNVTDKNTGEEWNNEVLSSSFDEEHDFGANLILDGTFGSVKINVSTIDVAKNKVFVEDTIEGAVESVINWIASWFIYFFKWLVEIAKAIAKATNVVLGWIIENLVMLIIPYAWIAGHNIYRYVNERASEKPEVSSVSDLKAMMSGKSYDIERDVKWLFKPYTDALYYAGNFISPYLSISGVKQVFVYVLGESIKVMLSVFGEMPSLTVPSNVANNMWNFLNEHVDITDIDSYRKFFLQYAESMIGSEVQWQRVLKDNSEYKFAVVVGEYNSEIENSVKHDVDELYKMLWAHDYCMLEIGGHYENLQLSRDEIKELFEGLDENLKDHPNAKVFMAFIGHGWTDGSEGGYVLSDGSVYLWSDMAYDFDYAILDQNGDHQLSTEELNNPPYSTLIMLFSTCHSRYAIDEFAVRDFPQKRILIAIADYDENASGWNYPPISFIFFTGHFTNKLQGDNWEEFLMTFTQVGLLPIIILTTLTMVAKIISFGFEVIGAALIGFLIGGLIMGIVSVGMMNTGGNSIYSAANFGAKWGLFGMFFGVKGSHAFMYNQQLAKEVIL